MPPASNDISRENALQALEWLVAMGADEVIGEAPLDRLAALPAAAAVKAVSAAPQVSAPRSAPASLSPLSAQADPASCQTIAELAQLLSQSDCPLQRTATHLCFSEGRPEAAVMVIGDVPGREEDLSGKVCDGPQALLLSRMLQAIGLSVNSDVLDNAVSLFNFIPWRPPGNRQVTEAEITHCLPFIARAIDLCRPRAILSFGALPAQRLACRSEGLLGLRGKVLNIGIGDVSVPLVATFSPRHLLAQPAQKRLAWQDLLTFRVVLDGAMGS